MSIYGDLSKPQRDLMTRLFQSTPTAVSIDTAVSCRIRPQLIKGLRSKGLAEFREGRFHWRGSEAWLTPAGLEVMRSLDFRHARRSVIR